MKVELLQKLWYQEPSRRQRASQSKKLSVKMKEIPVIAEEKAGQCCERESMWKGTLRLPPNLTPSYKYDFLNSISYILRLNVMVVGDKVNGKVTGESPIYIGNARERGEEEGEDDEVGKGNADSEAGSGCSGIDDTLFVLGLPMTSRSMNCIYNDAETFGAERRPRTGSVTSIESSASSTPSLLRFPPSFSQLSSRRPTLETLPPEYCQLDLQEQFQEEEEAQGDDDRESKEME